MECAVENYAPDRELEHIQSASLDSLIEYSFIVARPMQRLNQNIIFILCYHMWLNSDGTQMGTRSVIYTVGRGH